MTGLEMRDATCAEIMIANSKSTTAWYENMRMIEEDGCSEFDLDALHEFRSPQINQHHSVSKYSTHALEAAAEAVAKSKAEAEAEVKAKAAAKAITIARKNQSIASKQRPIARTKPKAKAGRGGSINMSSKAWSDCFQSLKAFKEKYGHCSIKQEKIDLKNDKNMVLLVFFDIIREEKKKVSFSKDPTSFLTQDRINALNGIGFDFGEEPTPKPQKISFRQRIDQLQGFRKIYGHCNVPPSHDRLLSQWVTKVRCARKKPSSAHYPTISEENIKLLDALNFEWDLNSKPGPSLAPMEPRPP